MINLNDINGASNFIKEIVEQLLTDFSCDLIGCEMGIAYGGGVEMVGKLWKDRGVIYGFDTFEGHPKQIGRECKYTKKYGGDLASATLCMDNWYNCYGYDDLSYEHIREELDKQELSNVILVKGLITEKTDLSFISELHYAFLDLDFPLSMWNAYNLVKDKVIPGGYLCLHDVIPHGHIPGCFEYYQEMLSDGLFEVIIEHPESYIVILRKK